MTDRFQLGIDWLLSAPQLRRSLGARRVALLGNPASVTGELHHTLDALSACEEIDLTAALGPQHGMRGEKQDNMVESEDYMDPVHRIPVFSLYGAVRRPTARMLDAFDLLLVDLQDVGCRVYTFLTTLCYLLEGCAAAGKALWILDRPNPAGRSVEGATLLEGQESFVGVGSLPMRHGLTLGEAARWYVAERGLDLELTVVEMSGYRPKAGPGFGWPVGVLPWVHPSPNASSLNMARCYAGTVLLEGTHLSEGRGTTMPLEVMGAPGLSVPRVLSLMEEAAPEWMQGCRLRECTFEPMFHKHTGSRCHGIQIHATAPFLDPSRFRPYRVVALFLRTIHRLYPDLDLWRQPPYEYESERLPIDVINGGPSLREWVESGDGQVQDLDAVLSRDETVWEGARKPFLLY